MAHRVAAERLTALAHATGKLDKTVPEILFVCVHNAGRSQMAAALLDHAGQGRVHVRSAGSLPASEINPAVGVVPAGATESVPMMPLRMGVAFPLTMSLRRGGLSRLCVKVP